MAAAVIACGQLTTEQKVADFTSTSQFYVRHYTPANWKIVQSGFDLRDLRPWLEKVRATKNDVEYYDVVIDYLASLNDGHIRYSMPSNFQAYLYFDVDIYDGKTLIEYISPTFPIREFPIAVGDEIVSVDGVTSEQWITRLRRYGIGANESATRRRAADFITFRPQSSIPWAGDIGEKAKVVVRRADGATVEYEIPWVKYATPVKNQPPVSGPRLATSQTTLRNRADHYQELAREWGVTLEPRQMDPEDVSVAEAEARSNQIAEAHPVDRSLTALGQLTPLFSPPAGFRLRLGGGVNDFFLSGTFQQDGKTIGLIRVPSFGPANLTLAVQQFRSEIVALEASTSALVIDVMHNPGGNVCFAETLMRYLSPRPFWGVGYWMKPTLAWKLYFESRTLQAATSTAFQPWERTLLAEYNRLFDIAYDKGEETGVFPICSSSVTQFPADVVYTKPVMVLTNEFSVSAGDTFPALFQDAGRGKIVGVRTGGLGGNVNDFSTTGITEASLRVTRSLIIRERAVPSPYGPTRFIENTGVAPDVTIDIMTRENLLNAGRPFRDAWQAELQKLLQ